MTTVIKSQWKKGSLFACEICGHHIAKHTPKCAVKSCHCHYDPENYPQFYVVRRTLYEIFVAQGKANKYLWSLGPDGARWPADVITGHVMKDVYTIGKKPMKVKKNLFRPVTDKEQKMFRRIVKLEETACRKLASRIHNVLYRKGQALPEPARYICDYEPVKDTAKADLRTGPRSAPKHPGSGPADAHPRQHKSAIGENEHKSKRKRGRKKKAPEYITKVKVVKSVKAALASKQSRKHPLLSRTVLPCGCVIRKHAGGFTFRDRCRQHGNLNRMTHQCATCGQEFLHRRDLQSHKYKKHAV